MILCSSSQMPHVFIIIIISYWQLFNWDTLPEINNCMPPNHSSLCGICFGVAKWFTEWINSRLWGDKRIFHPTVSGRDKNEGRLSSNIWHFHTPTPPNVNETSSPNCASLQPKPAGKQWASSRCLQCPGAPRGRCRTRNIHAQGSHPRARKTRDSQGTVPSGVCQCSTTQLLGCLCSAARRGQLQEQLSQKSLFLHSSAPSWKRPRCVPSQSSFQQQGEVELPAEMGTDQKVINWRTNHRNLLLPEKLMNPVSSQLAQQMK